MRIALIAALFAAALLGGGCEESKRAPVPGPPLIAPAAQDADAAALLAPAQPRASPDEIVLGEVGPLTGAQASFGDSTHKGVELAVKLLNEKGGVKGRRLKVHFVDDKGKPELAAAAVERLVEEGKAVLILGEATSAPSIAMSEVAERLKVPMISHAATSPKVTEGRAYVFRVCFTDPFQGLVMARFVREKLSLSKVAVLKDAKNDYSNGLAQSFVARFKAAGGKVLREETFTAGDLDFKAQLTAIKAAGAEAVYVPGYYGDVATIARQAKALGLSAPLLGGDGWSSEKLASVGGAAVEGCYFSDHYSTQDPSPRTQEFLAEYRAAYGAEPDSFAALGYDAARVAANAIARAKSLSGADVRDSIAATKDFDGVTGSITIDARHDAAKPAVVLKVVGGKPVYQTTVAP